MQTILFKHIGPLISNPLVMAVTMRSLPGTLDRTTLEDRCAKLVAVLEKFALAKEAQEEWAAVMKGEPGTMTLREFIVAVRPVVEMHRESCTECEELFEAVDVVAEAGDGDGEERGDESDEVTKEGS